MLASLSECTRKRRRRCLWGGPDQVVAAPGTQALLHWLARLTPTRSVAILGFTYGEQERVWRQAGGRVGTVEDLAALALADVTIVVNPNNPDGRLVSADSLLDLSAALARRSGTPIVDEAFIDVLPF
jgi:cobalamin biosynthesis protein CobC